MQDANCLDNEIFGNGYQSSIGLKFKLNEPYYFRGNC